MKFPKIVEITILTPNTYVQRGIHICHATELPQALRPLRLHDGPRPPDSNWNSPLVNEHIHHETQQKVDAQEVAGLARWGGERSTGDHFLSEKKF